MTEKTPDCSCPTCQASCRRKPGWFIPSEIEPAAKFLNLSVEDFFKQYLGVDWWQDTPDIYLLSPAVTSMTPGTMFSGDPLGTCVFFKEGRCSIHPVKPFECWASDHSTKEVRPIHKAAADAWRDHQEMVKKVAGFEPESDYDDAPSTLDALGRLF